MASVTFVYFDIDTGFYPTFHHGLASVAAALRHDGHQVRLHHLRRKSDLENAKTALESSRPDVIGLSFTSNQKQHVSHFLETIDSKAVAKLLIAGGVHATVAKGRLFEDLPTLDGVCVGEGEIPLRELCRRLDNQDDYLSTPSFCFNTPEGPVHNPVLPLQDLGSLPPPDYSVFDYQAIVEGNGECFPMLVTRGCPYSCSYCCNHALRGVYPNTGKYTRFPRVDYAIDTVRNNLRLYPDARKITFHDDIFALNKKWLFEFCQRYEREIGRPFSINTRVETIDDEVVTCLKRAGCTTIRFGLETGNEWLRRQILNRRESNQTIRDAFATVHKHGMRTYAFSMVGLPFETASMAAETRRFNWELWPSFGACFFFYPYEGTRLHALCQEYGLLRDGIETLSGFRQAPALKEVFMTEKQARNHLRAVEAFLYGRIVFSQIRLPRLLEKALLRTVVLPLKKLIAAVMDPYPTGWFPRVVRASLRKLGTKYLR